MSAGWCVTGGGRARPNNRRWHACPIDAWRTWWEERGLADRRLCAPLRGNTA